MRAPFVFLALSVVAAISPATAQQRRAFEIAVGPVSGDLYVQGERLAGVVSHPPGLSRCAEAALCGPEGLIAAARASANLSEGLLAIARGEIASAFSPADVAAAMRLNAGKGKQNQSRLRTIGAIGEETLYIIAAAKGPVRSLRGLRGRWVGIGSRSSRVRVAATALLAAARLKTDAFNVSETSGVEAAALLKQKKLDAFVWIGPKLPSAILEMLKAGTAQMVPVDKNTLARLTGARLGYAAKQVDGVDTVAVPVVWLADEKLPEDVVFGVVRAAFEPRNAPLLRPAENDPSSLRLTRAPADFPVPIHPGATRYFAMNVKPSN